MGLLALLRNEGGSFGTSMSQTIEQRREQFHLSRLGDYLGPLNQNASDFLNGAQSFFLQQTGDPVASRRMAVQALDNLRQQQAASLSYFDIFWLGAVLGIALVLLVPLMSAPWQRRERTSARNKEIGGVGQRLANAVARNTGGTASIAVQAMTSQLYVR